MAIALAVFAFLSAETFGLDAVFMDGHGMAALAAAARDPLSLIDKRSPGSRLGKLLQTKPGKKPPPSLSERGLIKPPPGPEDLPPPAPVFAIREVIPPPPGEPKTAIPVEIPPPPPEAPPPGVEGPPPIELPPPGGGFPGGGGPPFEPPVTFPPGGSITIPPGPVPEPDVWAMLIVGFFAIGGAMRARRARNAASKLGDVRA